MIVEFSQNVAMEASEEEEENGDKRYNDKQCSQLNIVSEISSSSPETNIGDIPQYINTEVRSLWNGRFINEEVRDISDVEDSQFYPRSVQNLSSEDPDPRTISEAKVSRLVNFREFKYG